jgi:membrane-associated phospholipid phosphatase
MSIMEAGTVNGQPDGRAAMYALWLSVIGAAVLSCIFVDVPAAHLAHAYYGKIPSPIESFLDGSRYYGQVFSLVMITLLIVTLDPARRREAMLLLLAALSTSLLTSLFKGIAGRARPYEFIENGGTWSLLHGFGNSAYGSFPSAHATSAFAMSAVLSKVYRRGRWVFYAAAALCAVSRVIDLQHYISDIIIGAALGAWLGAGVTRWRWSNRIATDLARLLPRAKAPPPGDDGSPLKRGA